MDLRSQGKNGSGGDDSAKVVDDARRGLSNPDLCCDRLIEKEREGEETTQYSYS